MTWSLNNVFTTSMKEREIWKICMKTKIYLWLIVLTLAFANLLLLQKLNEHVLTWRRFTYEDWIATYKMIEDKWEINLTEIINIYWTKNTEYKNFLLKKYEVNHAN